MLQGAKSNLASSGGRETKSDGLENPTLEAVDGDAIALSYLAELRDMLAANLLARAALHWK